MKKYILTEDTEPIGGVTLHQIQAVRSFNIVKEGDLGGWIEKEENLSHEGNAWVYDNAMVYGNARVINNARIWDNAHIYGNAYICDSASVFDSSKIYDNAKISGNTIISGRALVRGHASIKDTRDAFWFGPVGSQNGVLTAYRTKDGGIEVTRGCFIGSIDEFEEAVRNLYTYNKYGEEYLALIDVIKLRFQSRKKSKWEKISLRV